jgi:hypothetical protein
MESFCCEITLTTMRTAYHWNILNDKEALAFPVAPAHAPDACSFLSTDITDHGITIIS